MHSRIYQITRNPVDEDVRLCSNDIPEWFYTSIADYVDDECNRDGDIEWLSRSLKDVASINGDKITFASDISAYFEKKYEAFIKAANELAATPFENFASYKDSAIIRELNSAYSDEYGFYVYDDDEYLDTIENFMRGVNGGETYYVGGIVDYHF